MLLLGLHTKALLCKAALTGGVRFKVIHLMLTSKKRMSAFQITRVMGFGSHRTARDMSSKIRAALVRDVEKLGGIVALESLVRFPEAPPDGRQHR